MNEFVWDNDGMILTGENLATRKENCSTATLLTGNPIWNYHRSNSDLGDEWPADNQMSHGAGLFKIYYVQMTVEDAPSWCDVVGTSDYGTVRASPGNVCNGQTRCAGWSGWTEILNIKFVALKIILLVFRPSFQFSLWKPPRLGNWLYFLHQMGRIGKGIPALLQLQLHLLSYPGHISCMSW
jgi:hypothetical protein